MHQHEVNVMLYSITLDTNRQEKEIRSLNERIDALMEEKRKIKREIALVKGIRNAYEKDLEEEQERIDMESWTDITPHNPIKTTAKPM